MSLPRYPEYRDSGVAWLGEIPAHWPVQSLKRVVTLRSGESITAEQIDVDGEYPVYGGNGLRGFTDRFTHEGRYALIGRQGALCGNVNYSSGKFWASEHAVVVTPVKPVSVTWLGELLRAMNLNQYSVSAAQPGLSVEIISNLRIPFPSDAEQQAIAAFLDCETAKIDALVTEQEKLLTLLAEKRQATISQAVTKGLAPEAPMKGSGVEWLGDVPAHWETRRGRFLYGQADDPPEAGDGVVTAFRDGQVTLRENRRTDGFTQAILEVGYQHVKRGDLVIHGMDAFAGAIGVSESDGKCTPEYSVLRGMQPGVLNSYFAAVLRVMAKRNFIYVLCPSVRERAPRFRYESFKDVLLPLPPVEEQVEIVRQVSDELSRIDALSAEATRAIALLKERRSALISAAVTGKIDVRNALQQQEACHA